MVLDVGANVSAKAAHLRQFAVMGHFYAQDIVGSEAPRVGLMSVGEEAVLTTLVREDAKLGLIFLDMKRAADDLTKLV